MKIYIKVLLLIFFVYVGVIFPQGNPDYSPYARKINISPPRFSITDVSTFWTNVAPSPSAVSRSASAFINLPGVGNFIYQFGGGSDASLTSVVRYNISTNTWETTGFQPIPAPMSAATAITIGTKIYLFGGEKFTGLGKTFAFDATSGTWDANYAEMPTLVTDAAVVKYSDNYILIIGGGDGYYPGPTSTYAYSDQVQLFDVNNRTYSVLPNSSYPLKIGMLGAGIFNDTIISAGGLVSTGSSWGVVDSAYRGIISKDANGKPTKVTWTPLPAKYPGGPTSRMASVTVRKGNGAGVLFTGGAYNGADVVPLTCLWDLVNYKWVPLPDLPLGRANMKAAFAPVDTSACAYVVAGYTTIGTGRTDKLTFLKIDGTSFSLNPFNLVIPVSGSSFTTIAGSLLPIAFDWDTSASGAGYRFKFYNSSGNTVIDTLIFQNLLKITSGDLDILLGRKGMNQGDSIIGTWNVTAYKGPGAPGAIDSLASTNGPWNLTLKRNRPVLNAFNLVFPASNTTIITSKLNTYPVYFKWNKSAEGANYKVMIASPSFDSLQFIKFRFTSGSNGLDTVFTVLNSSLDSLLGAKGVQRGDSLVSQWKVYAYSRNDSLASTTTYNITLRRSPFSLVPFSLLAPPNNTTISLSTFSVVNFNWNVAASGANYKWTFNSLTLPSNNNGLDTNLTITTSVLDAILGSGSTITGTWKIWAFKGIDSIVSSQSFNITFTRIISVPLYQTFDSLQFPPMGWNIDFTGENKWSRVTPNGNPAAKYDFYNSQIGTTQSLITNIFPPSKAVTNLGSDSLFFDYAHAYVGANNLDSLFVYYSVDGGVSYTIMQDANYGSNPVPFASLSTTTYTAGPYSPAPNEWGTKILPLPAGTNRLKFVTKSGWGNNLYIDNIKLKNKPPTCILPPDLLIDVVKNPVFKWDLTYVSPGYQNTYKLQIWTDTTYTDTTKLVKEVTVIDTNVYNYPTNLPVDSYYGWRVSISNQGGTSRYSIRSFVFFIDSIFALNNDFSIVDFPQKCWRINSFGNPSYWSRNTSVGVGDNFSAKYNFYTAPPGTQEEFVTNTFPNTHINDTLSFNYAHAFVGNFNTDSLFIYLSNDNGRSWTKFDSSWGSNPVPGKGLSTATLAGSEFVPTQSQWGTKILVLPDGRNKIKFVTLSGRGNSLYIDNIRLNSVPLSSNPPVSPTVYKLENNYPNPFNPATTISFSIPKTSLTKLIIYDVLGREVTRLVNQVMNPGEYKVQFNGTNLSSGVYFYRLEAGEFVSVKKMLLIK
jgi:hypothetical protein